MQAHITEAAILPNGPLGRLGRRTLIFDELDSTNAYLLLHAGELPDGTVVVAEHQSVGRGRLGRRWEAPRGAAVLLSVLLKEAPGSALAAHATIAATVAACGAVATAAGCQPEIRWPNDLMLSGRKLGGVLVETTAARPGTADAGWDLAVVIGIGINCLQQRGHFSGALAESATSLEIESPEPVDRPEVARHLLERLDTRLTLLKSEPEASNALLKAWKARCRDIGTRVTLEHDRRRITGTILDISGSGDLLVQLDEGGRRYFASATTTRLT